jgi:hypothetical protein
VTLPLTGKGYLVFVLSARGDADTQVVRIQPETPEAQIALRDSVGQVKACWGECSKAQPLIIEGSQAKQGKEGGK